MADEADWMDDVQHLDRFSDENRAKRADPRREKREAEEDYRQEMEVWGYGK